MATAKKEAAKQVAVERIGEKIVIPDGMSFDDAIDWMKKRKQDEEREVRVHEKVDAYPFDGAYALAKALAHKFGWVDLVPTPGFWGSTPPHMVGVEVAPGETVQVPWGRLQIPGVDGYIETGMNTGDGRLIFEIGGVVKQKNKKAVAEIAALTRQFVKESSIYRGKAIRVAFPEAEKEKFDPNNCPKFLDVTQVRPEELVFSDDVNRSIQTSLFTPVEKTAQCRQYGIPLKRGILLEGPYGTGKTLTANVAARKCVDNGWTFIYVDSVSNLKQALSFAAQYQPAMLFAEDIDRVMEGDDRDSEMDAILNTVDGIESKSTETIVVLTTNHVEKINQAMLRPGRLDAVISVKPPDADAVSRLVQLFGRGRIRPGEDLLRVGKLLQGQIPAVIREVVERAKLSAVTRLAEGSELEITAADLAEAANGMLEHLKLLEPRPTDDRSSIEKFGDVVGGHLLHGVSEAVRRFGPVPEYKGNGKLPHTSALPSFASTEPTVG